MKFGHFFQSVLSNILHIQYLASSLYNTPTREIIPHDDTPGRDDSITLDWVLGHMGTRGNYPNHLFNDTVDPITEDYTLDQMQVIIRHGTRYPVISGINAIQSALLKLNESTNETLIGWTKTFLNEYYDRRTGQLSQKGQMEEYLIGKRLGYKYPEFMSSLIDGDVVSNDFQASTSWSNRTSQSGQAFCIGAFEGRGHVGPGNLMSVPILTLPQNNDSLIAMEKTCPRWEASAKKTAKELVKPQLESYLIPIAERLSMILGIDLSLEDVENLHDACLTEISMHQRVETFCKLFIRDDIRKLEYIDDLAHYYKHSYGMLDLNKYLACDLGKNIIRGIETQSFRLDLKFGHSETTLPLRTFLGLYQDEPLLSPNSTEDEVKHRLFKMSNFGYFANNIAFQLLSNKSSSEQFVRLLDNEAPIFLPGCKDILCPLAQFKTYMYDRINNCNFIDFCSL